MRNIGPQGLPLTREEAVLCDFPFLRYVRRQVPAEVRGRLVGYWAKYTAKWCVGVWVNKLKGEVIELAHRGKGDPFTAGDAAMIKFYFTNRYTIRNRQAMKKAREIPQWKRDVESKTRVTDADRRNRAKGRVLVGT